MKTLDEVIKALEYCGDGNSNTCIGCPYADVDGEAACFNHDREDALHYLKEYREKQDEDWRQSYIAVRNEILLGGEDDNPPLTWRELKQMEGKPVWVEWAKTEESYWCFVGEWFDDDEMRIYHIGRDYADYIHKTVYTPDIVQAYRKERE